MAVKVEGSLLAGRYRVARRLGRGGMATVFLAQDERLGREVAIKLLHAESPEDAARRFEREARLGASLNHPNIVQVFDIDSDPSGVLIVMEYVKGWTLQRAMAAGSLERRRAIEVLAGVASALDHAHAHGVVHRDVKPANVLIRTDGVVKVSDFGIATAASVTQITRSGTLLGTPAYMAPEQLEGRPITAAVDVYALAALAYEVLSGQRARSGRTPVEIARQVVTEPPPDLRAAWPEAPPAVAEALRRGMAAAPADRPPSAGQLVNELEAAGRLDDPTAAITGSVPGPFRPPEEAPSAPPPAVPAAPAPRDVPAPEGNGHLAAGPAKARIDEAARPAPPRDRGAYRRPPPPKRDGHRPRPRAPVVSPSAPAPAYPRRHVPRWLPIAALAGALAAGGAFLALASGGDDPRPSGRAADRGASGTSAEPKAEPERRRPPRSARATTTTGEASAPRGTTPPAETGEAAPSAPAAPAPAPPRSGPPSVAKNPVEGRRLNDQGFALSRQGRVQEAIPVLERAVASFPENSTDINYAFALFNLAHAYRLAGRPAEAIPLLEKRLTFDNQRATVQRELQLARQEARRSGS